MSTVIYPSPIFGPIHSRRLGVSLGINLLPGDGKLCSFDCIYCECGFNADHRTHTPLPTTRQVLDALENKLREMQQQGPHPDVLTFAGNGEPTLHPHFADIIRGVAQLRHQYFPAARISLLSNATRIRVPAVREAMQMIDNCILKLDTADATYINKVDRPQGHYDVDEQIEIMSQMNTGIIIQTMFMGGEMDGESVDNTGEEYVGPWLQAVSRIRPRQVMIYTIDRETPAHELKKATHEQLDAIAARVSEMGIPVSVSY